MTPEEKRERNKAWREANIGYMKAYREANKERIKKSGKAHYENNKELYKVWSARNRERATGFSPELFNAVLKYQKQTCAICGKRLCLGKHTHADHCHAKNQPRGVLCRPCNTGLGNFADNPETLQRAIEYLKLPPAVRMLVE